jgi:ribosomal protein L24
MIRTWKIRPGDLVYVNSGNDRGSSGEVLMIDPRRNMLKVKGMNKRKAPWRCYAGGRQAMNDWIMMDHVYGL